MRVIDTCEVTRNRRAVRACCDAQGDRAMPLGNRLEDAARIDGDAERAEGRRKRRSVAKTSSRTISRCRATMNRMPSAKDELAIAMTHQIASSRLVAGDMVAHPRLGGGRR